MNEKDNCEQNLQHSNGFETIPKKETNSLCNHSYPEENTDLFNPNICFITDKITNDSANSITVPIKDNSNRLSFVSNGCSLKKSQSFSKLSLKRSSSGEFRILKKYLNLERVRRSFHLPKCRIIYNNSNDDVQSFEFRKYSAPDLQASINEPLNISTNESQLSLNSSVSLHSCLKKQSKTSESNQRVKFGSVSVYCFERTQGFGSVPTVGGISLGMSERHWAIEIFEKEEDLHFGRRVKPIYRHPLPPKTRKTILNNSGVKKFDQSETSMCKTIRLSRSICGCKCANGICLPGSCECSLNGIACQIDIGSYPCSCAYAIFCSNTSGRTEFSPLHVKAHYIHTMNELSRREASFTSDNNSSDMGGCLHCESPTPQVNNLLQDLQQEQKRQSLSHKPSISRRDSAEFSHNLKPQLAHTVFTNSTTQRLCDVSVPDCVPSNALCVTTPSFTVPSAVCSPVFPCYTNSSLLEVVCDHSSISSYQSDANQLENVGETRIYEQAPDQYEEEQIIPEDGDIRSRRYSTPAYFDQHLQSPPPPSVHFPARNSDRSSSKRSLLSPPSIAPPKSMCKKSSPRKCSVVGFPNVDPSTVVIDLPPDVITTQVEPTMSEPSECVPHQDSSVDLTAEDVLKIDMDNNTVMPVDQQVNTPDDTMVIPRDEISHLNSEGLTEDFSHSQHGNHICQIMGVEFYPPERDELFHLPDEIVKLKLKAKPICENRKSSKSVAPLKTQNKVSKSKSKYSTPKMAVIPSNCADLLTVDNVQMKDSHSGQSKTCSKYRSNIFDSIKKVFKKSKTKPDKEKDKAISFHLQDNDVKSCEITSDESQLLTDPTVERTICPHGDKRINLPCVQSDFNINSTKLSEMPFTVSASPTRSNIENLPDVKTMCKNSIVSRKIAPKSKNYRKSCIDLCETNPYYLTRHTLKQYYSKGVLTPVMKPSNDAEDASPAQGDQTDDELFHTNSNEIDQATKLLPTTQSELTSSNAFQFIDNNSQSSQSCCSDTQQTIVRDVTRDNSHHQNGAASSRTIRKKAAAKNLSKQKIGNRGQYRKSASLSALKVYSPPDKSNSQTFTKTTSSPKTHKSSRFQSQLSASALTQNDDQYSARYLDPYYLTRRQLKQLFHEPPTLCLNPITSSTELSQSTQA